MNFFRRIFQTSVWKFIALLFIATLTICVIRFLFVLQDSASVVHSRLIERGMSAAWEIDEVILWGRVSLVMLLFIGVMAIVDLFFQASISRKYAEVTAVIENFAAGDHTQRAPNYPSSPVRSLANSFNMMADTIVSNIERLKEIDTLRRELVANVAHDLGGPVTSILGYVETVKMKEGKISPAERATLLNTTLAEVKALGKLVAELFDLSKLDAKAVEPKIHPFSVVTLAQDVASRFIPQAIVAGIELKVPEHDSIPLVLGDIDLIERVLSNIFENAFAHTRAGGVVSVHFKEEPGIVRISVSDTGEGIPEADLPFVFDRFYRVGLDRSRASGGAGLGLAIVKKILEAHNSPVHIESALGKGTVLSFTLKKR